MATPAGHLFKPVFKQVARVFQLPIFQVEEVLSEPENLHELQAFQQADGPSQLLICRQRESISADISDAWDGTGLCITHGDGARCEGRGVLLMKATEGVELDAANIEKELSISSILGGPVKTLHTTFEHLYLPLLSSASSGWAAKLPDEAGADLLSGMQKFVSMLNDSAMEMDSGIELERPSVTSSEIELKTAAFSRAALNSEIVRSFEAALISWTEMLETLLDDAPPEAQVVSWVWGGVECHSTQVVAWVWGGVTCHSTQVVAGAWERIACHTTPPLTRHATPRHTTTHHATPHHTTPHRDKSHTTHHVTPRHATPHITTPRYTNHTPPSPGGGAEQRRSHE